MTLPNDLPNVFEFLSALGQALSNERVYHLWLDLTLMVMLTVHGMFVLMLTVIFHAVVDKYLKPGAMLMSSFLYFIFINLIFISHVLDILTWTYITIYLKAVPEGGAINAYYFVGEMYTTLGFGGFKVNPEWRTLPILIAISGILSSAISGAALYSMLNALLLNKKLPLENIKKN